MKGSYVLLVRLPEEQMIRVGGRGSVFFPGGHYAYVGSAMGGFSARVGRHLRESKKPRWHIDYLLQKAVVTGVILCEAEKRLECTIARVLKSRLDSIPGFGASDCQCRSHLFFATDGKVMESTVMRALDSLGVRPTLAEKLP